MITVIGLGFVGLTTALGFADAGFEVVGIEKSEERREAILKGEVPFYEPGLVEPLKKHIGKNFKVSAGTESIGESDYVFFCVGTPCDENGSADLTYLYGALSEGLKAVKSEKEPIFIVKSTVPPSTTFGKIADYITKQGFEVGRDVYLANNPEFLREGYCWEDFTKPGRIVVGAEDGYVKEMMTRLYQSFGAPIHLVSGNTAEFIKYVSNSMLATLISFSNEMAEVAESIGNIQISDAFHILHEDERWNGGAMTAYLYPGCGYGGYCLPKDTVALSAIARNFGVETSILDKVIARNDDMAESIAKRIAAHVSIDQTIGILGLSFKPGSDDVRACSSAKVIKALIAMGYKKFKAYDPVANQIFEDVYHMSDYVEYKDSLDAVLKESQIGVILTGWEEFKRLKDAELSIEILDYRYIL